MLWFRLPRVCLHLLAGLLTAALVFPFVGVTVRGRLVKRWSVKLLLVCRVQVIFNGDGSTLAHARALIVANHVSWLDIFVINAILPCRFVAKSDIRDWPLVGWLCNKAGTIFISRGRIRDVRLIFENLVASLQAGEHVAFFPEGTTAAQGTLLPFHANLFEAAIDAQVPVQPFALRYVDAGGGLHPAADFIGEMTFAQSMLMILRSEVMHATLVILPALASNGAHRRELALAAHAAIGSALGIGVQDSVADKAA
jgi:1-acyl-sn-glycerol-3-phosphate acyltransferase